MKLRRLFTIACLVWTIAQVTPAQTPPAAPAAPPSRDFSAEPFVLEKVSGSIRFEADGTGAKTLRTRVRVQTDGGVQQLGTIVLDYNADLERMKVTGRVVKPDGTTIEIPETAAQDMSSPVSRIAPLYSDTRQKHVIVPGLRPGDVLEYEIQVDLFTAVAPNQFWVSYDFEKDAIVESEDLTIDVPSTAYVQVKSKPGREPEIVDNERRRVYRWKASHLERETPPDPAKGRHRVTDEDETPAVQITTFRDWNEIGQWYAALEKDRRAPDAAIRAKTADLTKNATSDTEKLQAIYDYVAKEYRYVSLSFGVGRYQPHAASAIFGNRYGDCKDKHTLLAAMARSAGLDAHAALTSGSRKIDESFPSPAQFDHVISYVTLGDEPVWLDTTTELAPFRMLVAPVRGKAALVVNPEGTSQLKTIPLKPAIPNATVIKVDGVVNGLGTLDADVRVAVRGDAEVIGRLGARAVAQARWKDLVRLVAMAFGTIADVSSADIANVTDTTKPLEYRFHVTIPSYVQRFEAKPKIVLPLGSTLFAEPEERDGKLSIDIGGSRSEYHAKISFPKQFEALLPVAVEQKRDFGTYASRYAMDGTALVADRTLDVTASDLPAARSSEFGAFRRTVVSDSNQEVRVRVAQGVPAEDVGGVKVSELMDAASAAFESRKYQDSIDLYERVVKAEPEHKTAYNDLGRAYLALGKFDAAEKALKQATEIDPFSPFAYNNLGRVYMTRRQYDQAAVAFRKQIEIDPLDKWSHENLGWILLQQEKYAEAETELEKAVAISPDKPNLQVSLGAAQLGQKKVVEARQSFARAIESTPIPPVWNDIAMSLAEHAVDLDRALEYATSAVDAVVARLRSIHVESLTAVDLSLVRSLGAYWDTLGWVYFKKKDLSHAERYLKSAWQLSQDEVVADHLGQVYERMGKRDQAIEYYAYAAAASHPETEARRHLTALVGKDDMPTQVEAHRARPAALRTFDVSGVSGEGNAEFFVVLAPGRAVEGVQFVSGDKSLRPAAAQLKKLAFGQDFPDAGDARIVRRGILSCTVSAAQPRKPASAPRACKFVLMLPEAVYATE